MPADAQAAAGAQRDVGDQVRAVDGVDDALRLGQGLRAVRALPQQDGEPLVAEPGEGVAGADRRAHGAGDGAEQLLAGVVAHGVVGEAGGREVDEQQGDLAGGGLVEPVPDGPVEAGPVG